MSPLQMSLRMKPASQPISEFRVCGSFHSQGPFDLSRSWKSIDTRNLSGSVSSTVHRVYAFLAYCELCSMFML